MPSMDVEVVFSNDKLSPVARKFNFRDPSKPGNTAPSSFPATSTTSSSYTPPLYANDPRLAAPSTVADEAQELDLAGIHHRLETEFGLGRLVCTAAPNKPVTAVYTAARGSWLANPAFWRMLWFFPLVASGVAISTIVVCFNIASEKRHYPLQMTLPFISLLGFRAPERYIFVGGLSVVFLLFLICSTCLYLAMHKWLHDGHQLGNLRTSYWWAVLAFTGLLGLAWVPLQSNVVDLLSMPADVVDRYLTTQTVVHHCFAGMFFIGSAAHGMFYLLSLRDAPRVFSRFGPLVWWSKACFLLFAIAPAATAVVFHPTARPGTSVTALSLPVTAQWLAVFSFMAMYASFSLECACIHGIMMDIPEQDQAPQPRGNHDKTD